MESNHYDVIVVGAGMAGILSAYYLQKEGKTVLILESNEVGSGQTEKTTAKMTSQHGLKYAKLKRSVGMRKAKLYAQANEKAIDMYEQLIQEEEIACEFKRVPACIYTKKDAFSIQKETQVVMQLGLDAYYTNETELPFSVKAALVFRNQAQFSPLKFLRHLADQLNILEHTKVVEIRGHEVICENKENRFYADDIVVATHYPIKNCPGFYFLRQHQERSHVLSLSGCKKIHGMYLGIDSNGYSLRQAGENIWFGGCGHRTGCVKKDSKYKRLIEASKQIYPNSKIEAAWSAQDCMPHDGLPFIGRYSVFTPHLYVATGFGKWGMTSSMVSAMILRDLICEKENPYAKIFSPQRFHLFAGIDKLMIDIGISIKGLFMGWLGKEERRCSHLGCALSWNNDEETWDCPCHGSRFSKEGRLLDNPSKIDLKH